MRGKIDKPLIFVRVEHSLAAVAAEGRLVSDFIIVKNEISLSLSQDTTTTNAAAGTDT
jgi:hypothetical protein